MVNDTKQAFIEKLEKAEKRPEVTRDLGQTGFGVREVYRSGLSAGKVAFKWNGKAREIGSQGSDVRVIEP